MAILEITVVPLGTKETSVSAYVAECLRVLEEEGVKYQLTPMSTIIEGELDHLFDIAKKLHHTPFETGEKRVTTTIRIDDRRDKTSTLEGKVAAVKEKL